MELKSTFAQDDAGNLIRTVTCHLYLRGTTTHATGLQNAAGAPLSNPWTVTGDGKIQFRAPDGEYDLRTVGGGRDYTRAIQCLDVTGQVAAAEAAADRAEAASGDAEQDRILAEAAKTTTLDYRNETQTFRDQAVAIVYGGDYSINAVAGNVPIADTDARLGNDWLHIGSAPNELPVNATLGALAYMSPESVVLRPLASAVPAGIGDTAFQLTSDTTLTIKVKGSDGTVRSVDLTLA